MIKIYSTFGQDYLPVKAEEDSAGWDLISPEEVYLYPGQSYMVDTGITVAFPDYMSGVWTQVLPRSGRGAMRGQILRNSVAVIDKSYRGPGDTIKVMIHNLMNTGVVERYLSMQECLDLNLNPDEYQSRPVVDPQGDVVKDVNGDVLMQICKVDNRVLHIPKDSRFCQMIFMNHISEVKFQIAMFSHGVREGKNRGGFGSTGD